MSRIIKLIIEYDGSDFYGWQIQPDLRTVQGEIENALRSLTQQQIRIVGSGRTDTGVHALGQVVSFPYDGQLNVEVFFKGLNAVLPKDIRIHHAEVTSNGFNARKKAIRRMYRYRLFKTETAIGRQYGWYPSYKYDIELMKQASEYLLGNHEWDSFAKPRPDNPDMTAEIYDIQWHIDDMEILFEITASRFFHSMIRFIVGTLMDVGRRILTPQQFKEILDSRDLSKASAKAPACGLVLVRVDYA
ncbi:tRNA pseudouridine(38-40) synthase TruA [bacterium]